MLSINDIELWMKLGLTLCQARVYLALCRFEILDAKTVSKCANVSRQDVYRITADLHKLGLVEKVISTPIAYRALAADKGATILLERKKATVRRLESKTKVFLNNFQINSKKEPPNMKPEFILVPAKEAIIKKITKSIEQAQSSIDCVSSWKRLSRIKLFSESLEEAWSRGVKWRLISEKPEKGKGLESFMHFCRKSNLCEVRFTPSKPSTIMCMYDGKEVLLVVNPKAGMSESPALWSNNSGIVAALKDYFKILWLTALETPAYELDFEKALSRVRHTQN